MKLDRRKINSARSDVRTMPQINGKKIIACGLALLLVFMWIKVFLGSSEDGQDPITKAFKIKEANAESKGLRLKHRPLEYIPGRHDRLTTNMFAPRDMEIGNDDFDPSAEGKERVRRIKSQKDAAAKLSKRLRLDAIILGSNEFAHKAFINGKLYLAGDELNVKLNDKTYKVSVVAIFHNKVVFKWNDYTISVRMAKLDTVK